MRHRLQSRQVVIGITLALLMGAALCTVVVLVLSGPLPPRIQVAPSAAFSHRAPASVPTVAVGRPELLMSAGALLGLLCYGVVAIVLVGALYRRTGAGEAFFVVSYVISLSLEVARPLALLLFLRDSSPSLVLAVTRLVTMGRVFGLASLFLSNLCSLGLRYSDYAVLSGASLLLSVAIGAIVPVDSASLTTGFIHAVSDGGGFLSLGATASVVVVIGAAAVPIVGQDRYLAGYAAGIVGLVVGRELIALGGIVAGGVGLALLVGGTYALSRSLERVHLGLP